MILLNFLQKFGIKKKIINLDLKTKTLLCIISILTKMKMVKIYKVKLAMYLKKAYLIKKI